MNDERPWHLVREWRNPARREKRRIMREMGLSPRQYRKWRRNLKAFGVGQPVPVTADAIASGTVQVTI